MQKGGIIAIIIVVILIIAGIAVYYAMQPSSNQPTPPQKKMLVIGVTDKISDLDTSNAYDFYTWEVLNNIMGGLVTYKPGTADIVPAMAQSWNVNANATIWTFHLRKDVKNHNGTVLKAQDVVWSIERVMRINGDPAWLVTSFVKKVTATDDYTVVFTLKHPTAYFLALLTDPPYFPVSRAYDPNHIQSDQTAGGWGPYYITKWVRDQELDLQANPNYYGPKPKIEKIVIKFYKDATTMRLALQNGEINIAWRTLRPTDIESLKKSGSYNVVEIPSSYIRYICFNTVKGPTSDVRVRQALAYAIDRQQIAERVFHNTVEPLYTLIPIGMWSHKDVFKEKYGASPNLTAAKKLLEEAGYSTTNKLKINLWYTPSHYGDTEADIAQLLKQQWEATGMVEVTIKSAEWQTYLQYARQEQMEVYMFGWYPDYLDPDDYTTPFLSSVDNANGWAGTGYNNSEMNQILSEAQQLTNKTQREKLYIKAQEILAQDVPYIPFIQGKLYVVADKDIGGIIIGPDMIFHYNLLYFK